MINMENEMFCHIWGRYDPKHLWELFGNFRSDGNIGCFTTEGKKDDSFNRKGIFPIKRILGLG